MKEIKLKDIVAASLCQFGAFLFLTTFIFRPEVLTSYQSGDALALGPLPSALVTIVAMAVFGVICVAAAVREADHFERALSAFGFAVPCLSLALLLVRAPLVPPLVSALCGSACVVQAFGFARSNTLGFGATLLSVGLCLAVAAVASELSYRLFPLHLYGTMAVAGVMAVTGAVQLGRFAVRAGGLKLTIPPTVTPAGRLRQRLRRCGRACSAPRASALRGMPSISRAPVGMRRSSR